MPSGIWPLARSRRIRGEPVARKVVKTGKPYAKSQTPAYEPTADQIQAACLEIQAGWNEHTWQRQRRRAAARFNHQGSYRLLGVEVQEVE